MATTDPHPAYPIRLRGRVIRGFGRGSREIGIPTANIPVRDDRVGGQQVASGIYYGWAGLRRDAATLADAKLADGPVGAEEQQASSAPTNSTSTSTGTSGTTTAAAEGKQQAQIAIFPMVVSIGYNPFYNNTTRSVEVHIMDTFDKDFYHAKLTLSILGYLRAEENYTSLEALIEAIQGDIRNAQGKLEEAGSVEQKSDPYLVDFDWEDE